MADHAQQGSRDRTGRGPNHQRQRLYPLRPQDQNGKADSSRIHRGLRLSQRRRVGAGQSNRLETDSSAAVRPIASPIRVAIDSTLMLRATRTASVGWIESVMTSSLSCDAVRRATAPPDSTPWLI